MNAAEVRSSCNVQFAAARRAAEFLREYALLVGVFYPLDRFIQNGRLTATEGITTVVIVAALWTFGVILEVRADGD
jgi:hypothetical protein